MFNKKGFSLVELIVVIAIMAVLAAVLVPTVTNQVEKSADAKAITEANGILLLIKDEWLLGAKTKSEIIIAIDGKTSGRLGDLRFFANTDGTGEISEAEQDTVEVHYVIINNVQLKNDKYTKSLQNNIAVDKTAGEYFGELNLNTGFIFFNKH